MDRPWIYADHGLVFVNGLGIKTTLYGLGATCDCIFRCPSIKESSQQQIQGFFLTA